MRFTINGNEYEGAKYNYNTHCDMKEMGCDIAKFSKNPEGVLRAYFAVSSGLSLEQAGNEIEAHLIGGGSLNDLAGALQEEVTKSGFFQTLRSPEKAKRGRKSEITEA